jgi:hypothetical protein
MSRGLDKILALKSEFRISADEELREGTGWRAPGTSIPDF